MTVNTRIYRYCIPYPNGDILYQTEHGILLCMEPTDFKQTDDMLS